MSGGSIFDSPQLGQLWDRARASFTRNQKDPEKTITLEVRSEKVKVLYARVLALQSLTTSSILEGASVRNYH